jgi:hypothetical protein
MALHRSLHRWYEAALQGVMPGRVLPCRVLARLRLEVEKLEDRSLMTVFLGGSNNFTPIARDFFNNNGDEVASLAGNFINSTNPGAIPGIAVDGVAPGHGTWEYSLDGGTTWLFVPVGVSDNAALLLRQIDRLRFVPDGQNLDFPTVHFRAWDQTGGTLGLQGTLANVTVNAGNTPYSGNSEVSTLTVTILPSTMPANAILSGRFTGDTLNDVAQFNPNGTWTVGIPQSNGPLVAQTWAQWSAASQWLYVGKGDFNGDGKDDIIGFNVDGTVWVGQSNGSRFITTQWAAFTAPSASWATFQVGDFNGDGKDDLLAFNNDGSMWVAQSNAQGSGFITTQWTTFSPAINWTSIQVGDALGNGKDDVYGFNNDGSWWVGVSTGSSFTNQLWTQWSPAINWKQVLVGDFTGDGKDDITGFNNDGTWWVGVSTGTHFTDQLWSSWSLASNWAEAFVGDPTDSGRDSIIVFNNDGSWWTGVSTKTAFIPQEWAQWNPPAAAWPTRLVADFEGDHHTDILGFNVDGTAWLGHSTGSGFFTSRWS